MSETYVVQECEWLLKIAQDHGFRSEQPLLDANPGLSDQYGENTNVLPPGLEIEIPDRQQGNQPASTGAVTEFVAVNRSKSICLTLQDADGQPLAGWTCDLTIGDRSWTQLRTGGDGRVVVQPIPGDATQGAMDITPPDAGDGPASAPETITLQIGGLDPIVAGTEGRQAVQKMLANLGFYDGPIDGDLEDDTRAALLWFQDVEGVGGDDGPDGRADDATCQRLVEAQGSLMPPPVAPEPASA